jgi:hypothetical protein
MTQAFEMETVPSPGKALLYVRLSDVSNMSIADALKLLQGLGYAPELRYVQWASDPKQLTLFAWLKEETLPYGSTGETSNLWDEYELLIQKIQPSKAVCYAWAEHQQALATYSSS